MIRRFALLATIVLGSCTEVTGPDIEAMDIDLIADVLLPGDTTRAIPVITHANGQYVVDPDVVWQSSDTTILRVTDDATVIAVRPGTARLRMRYADRQTEREVVVRSGFVFVDAGHQSTCALTDNGQLYCWGDAWTVGSLSTTGTEDLLLPYLMSQTLRFQQVSVGFRHGCALTLDQQVYCWGNDQHGFGIGTPGNYSSNVPFRVPTDLRFTQITAGWEHSCGLTSDGTAYCWGRGYEGQLGTGTVAVFRTPVAVNTSLRFQQIQAGDWSTCALTLAGESYCWGWNPYLGAPMSNQTTPVRVNVPAMATINASEVHRSCGVTTTNQLYCWTNAITPVPAAGPVIDVAVGGEHACVTRTDGSVACLGSNGSGQLGDGSTTNSDVPVTPAGNLNFVQVSAGAYHTCGITDTGATYCWGNNEDGALGNGTVHSTRAPMRVLLSLP